MVALFALVISAAAAHANFVSYVDEKGTRHIVSSVEEIPEQYREKAKESRAGDASNAKAGGSSSEAGAGATTAKTEDRKPASDDEEAPRQSRRSFSRRR